MHDVINKLNTSIRWSFYLLFFFVPLAMWPDTYELFEFNKMWLVFGFSAFILFLWGSKMILAGRFEIRRTPLDIPIALFLISQIISTIISIDPHVSWWGYYSRFNGGLLSTICYIFLYYAFATNLARNNDNQTEERPLSYKLLFVSLLSGLVVTLWGIPGHFGADMTCLFFRGSLDVACWTDQFNPTNRLFSTLGQPNWLGTFLACLIPIALGFGLFKLKDAPKKLGEPLFYFCLSILFFIALLWTRSQSSFLGLVIGLIIFSAFFGFKNLSNIKESKLGFKPFKFIMGVFVAFFVLNFFIYSPIGIVNKFTTYQGIQSLISKPTEQPAATPAPSEGIEGTANIQIGGSGSGDIRLIVWKGAYELFKRHPLFGTGVETFAYAYYNVKPLEHNLTSEWDFLYNKAHNEYLNYLATTGIVGLSTYLLLIIVFYFYAIKTIITRDAKYNYLGIGIISGFSAILVSNFFGFSVVPINLLTFILPIIFLDLVSKNQIQKSFKIPNRQEAISMTVDTGKMIALVVLGILTLYFEFYLLNFWFADRSYALGYNLNKVGEIAPAFDHLDRAAKMLPGEDLYKDELAINKATLALALAQNNQATDAAFFARDATQLSEDNIKKHPYNVVFYKTRLRVAYALAQINPVYLDTAIAVAQKARELAPTDAKLTYNLALLYSQKGENDKMIELLDETIRLKPNYMDAYYAKGLLFSELAKQDKANAQAYIQEARTSLEYILKNIDPNNQGAKELLETL